MAIEDQLSKQNSPAGDLPSVNVAASSPASVPGTYQRGVPVHSQPLFTTAILTALKQVTIYFFTFLTAFLHFFFFKCFFFFRFR